MPFSVSFAEWALVLSYSALYYVVLRLGASRVECSSLPHSLLLLSPLRVQLPEWSVLPFVAVLWGEPFSVYSHIGVQFPADSDGCLCVVCIYYGSRLMTICFTLLMAYYAPAMAFLLCHLYPWWVSCCLLSLGSYSVLILQVTFYIDEVHVTCLSTSLHPCQCWESC